MAQETLKDPYLFDFLGLGNEAQERDFEDGLVQHITRFLLELGAGFAFMGRQYRLEVAGDEFFIDLLFYHTRLKCYVVVELKAGAFKPEHAGQLNFYLAAVDAQLYIVSYIFTEGTKKGTKFVKKKPFFASKMSAKVTLCY